MSTTMKRPSRQMKVHSALSMRFGFCCHACGSRDRVELHHIAQRGWSSPESEERIASECVELMLLLCKECHDKAHNDEAEKKLLRIKVKQYGEAKVRAAIDRYNETAGRQMLEYPEE